MYRSRAPRDLLHTALLAALAVAVLGCAGDPNAPGFFPPPPATEQGREINDLYSITFWIAAVIFVLVEGLIVWAIIRYRRRSDELPVQTHGNTIAELTWTVVPAAIVLFLFILTVQTLGKVEARSATPDLTVDVTGFQWQWTFKYEAQGLTFTGLGEEGPEMVLPVNETVRINLHGQDVNHAFYVPRFLYKKDVIPGRTNSFDVKVTDPGTYPGQCAEFCGLAHAKMNFTVRAVPRTEFDAWVASEQEKARQSPPAAPTGSPGGGQGGGETVVVSASNATAFDQQALSAPAGKPLTIRFENKDPAAPHNVAIRGVTPEGDFVGQPIAQPGQTQTYSTPPVAAGQYEFYCSVHPNMKGTFSVQ